MIRPLVSNAVQRMGMKGVMAYFDTPSKNLPAETEEHHRCLSQEISIDQHFACGLSNTRQRQPLKQNVKNVIQSIIPVLFEAHHMTDPHGKQTLQELAGGQQG